MWWYIYSGFFDERNAAFIIQSLLTQHLFEIFYNIKRVFSVTFEQFNASLLNKSIS